MECIFRMVTLYLSYYKEHNHNRYCFDSGEQIISDGFGIGGGENMINARGKAQGSYYEAVNGASY